MSEKLLDVKKVSEILGGIHIMTVYNMAAKGELPAVKIGRRLMFKESDIKKFIRTRVKRQ